MRRLVFVLILSVALSACTTLGVQKPAHTLESGVQLWGQPVAAPEIYEALFDDFLGNWAERFGDEGGRVEAAFGILSVHHLNSAAIAGRTVTVSVVQLDASLPPRRVLRVLQHELCHVALWASTGRPDPDHAKGNGTWTKDHDEFLHQLKAWG